MEAENYLAGGYGLRLSIAAHQTGWRALREIAQTWQPKRLKGILVDPKFGVPFLAATQVFDVRPTPRKWLSLDRTESAATRFVPSGTVLVTCSGSVGRATLSHRPHEGVLITHDLLRVEPKEDDWWGWIYAFLRSPQARAMMVAAKYGHIIKHLEVAHLDALPVPDLTPELREKFQTQVKRILELRRRAHDLTATAEAHLLSLVPSLVSAQAGNEVFSIRASEMLSGRRRLEASRYTPAVDRVVQALGRDAVAVEKLEAVARTFVPGRFKHVYGDGGVPYLDSADILEVNPDITKFVLSLTPEEQDDYRVEPGWLLTPCSGQVYGNIGHTVLATEWHVGKILSNHIMRTCPKDNIRPGYLKCVMGHPAVGRPQLVRLAFGSSVPEIAPNDAATIAIPRFKRSEEDGIADTVDAATAAQGEADELEEQLAEEAENAIDWFLAGQPEGFLTV